MILIKNFKEISKSDTLAAGGKGASLGEMTRAGIPVPPGFVILSDAFEKSLEETNLSVEIDSILHSVDHQKIHTIEDASEKIKALILQSEMPKIIADEIQKFFKKLGSKFVAVRSSATAEDSSAAAWAGQLESYLNTTEANLLENIKKCWASLFTPRAIFYRFEKGLRKQKISVAVVVQKMIESEVSGVAFSVHPVTQNKNQLIIEAGFGLGEAIVSGQIMPNNYVVEKEPKGIIYKNVQTQTRGIYRAEGGGNEWRDIEEKIGKKQVLSDEEILKLSDIILKIENHYGFPCDIEWAKEKGKFHILQSRPITTLTSKIIQIEKRLFVLEEIPEAFATPVYDFMEVKRINKFLNETIQTKNKFSESLTIYKNMNCSICFVADEFEELSKDLVSFYVNKPLEAKKLNELITSEAKKFFAYTSQILELTQNIYASKELFALWYKSYKNYAELHKYGWIHTLIDFKDNLFTKYLLDYLREKVRGKKIGANEAFVYLTTPTNKKTNFTNERKDFEKIVSLTKQKGYTHAEQIEKDEELYSLIDSHAQKYGWIGFGSIGPAWGQTHFLKSIIDDLNKKEAKTISDIAIEKKQKEILNALNIDKNHQLLFDLARELIEGKEYRKESMVHYYYALDKIISKLSSLTKVSKEVLRFIYPEELKNFNLDPLYIGELQQRVKYHINHITLTKDSIILGDKAKEYSQNFKFIKMSLAQDLISGSVAYPGHAVGIAKIINVKNELNKIQKGDILISIATNPDLVPAMKKVAAIVTDVGGITSHAAIVSRELQIPCVIGTGNATKIIKDGDKIEVDANKGIVKILK